MVDDPNRKTPRQFQCRDYLWDSFEQLSSELECSIDYLINEAMRHYLRAQGRTGPGTKNVGAAPQGERGSLVPGTSGVPSAPGGAPRMPTPAGPMRQPGMPSMPAARPPATAGMPMQSRPSPLGSPQPGIPPLGANARAPAAMPQMPTLPQRPPAGVAPPMMQQPQQPAAPMSRGPVGPGPGAPPMMSRPSPAVAQAVPQQRTLYAVYADQEVPVTKEEFFIGRGQRMCDLVIRDTNISRQHARVVLHNGQYWMIDNQSTNGVEYRGAKIQQKRIDEGDVFTICGHDVVFTYR